ncbi:MAG: hypothetical protein R3D67_13075 [Hyphomicrobiaceae bacterium]
MFWRLLRVLFGFALGCLAAGITMVLFVFTPSELAGLPPDVATDRFPQLMRLAGFVAAQAGLFAAPFALVIAVIGEWRANRRWTFYALAGLLLALLGFLAQHSTEQVGQPTIVNNYALTAFVTSGFVGGLVYWLFSGRLAGGPGLMSEPDIAEPKPSPAVGAGKTASVIVSPQPETAAKVADAGASGPGTVKPPVPAKPKAV